MKFTSRSKPYESRKAEVKPMKIGDVQMIEIDPTKIGTGRKDCKLNRGQYYVRKEHDIARYRKDKTFFFASYEKEFVRNDADEISENFPWEMQYALQLGFRYVP